MKVEYLLRRDKSFEKAWKKIWSKGGKNTELPKPDPRPHSAFGGEFPASRWTLK
jgi:hypothetical protein